MAAKDALAFIIDLGSWMTDAEEEHESNLHISLACITRIVLRKMLEESKDLVCLLLCGTKDTNNDLYQPEAHSDDYSHISLVRRLGPVGWDLLELLRDGIRPEAAGRTPTHADLVDAVVVAVDYLKVETSMQKGVSGLHILIFSNARSSTPLNQGSLNDILPGIKQTQAKLFWIHPDNFPSEEGLSDDEPDAAASPPKRWRPPSSNSASASAASASNSQSQSQSQSQSSASGGSKPLTHLQQENVRCLRRVLEATDGAELSFEQVLPQLSRYGSRAVKLVPWKAALELGSLKIPICSYVKIRQMKPMQLTKVFARDPTLNLNAATSTSTSNASTATVPKASAAAASRSADEDGEGEEKEAAAGAGYTVKTSRSYHLQNEEQTEVEATQQVLGYRFGSSIIPFSDDDRANMQYSCNKCFQLLGFTAARNVPSYLFEGDGCNVVVGDMAASTAAQRAISALALALKQLDQVAIVRKNYSNSTAPRLAVLVPRCKDNYECFILIELAYSQDIRAFNFPSLPLSDEILQQSPLLAKFKPSDEQNKVVDDLIDQLMISSPNEEETKPPSGKLSNPYHQRLCDTVARVVLEMNSPVSASLSSPAAGEVGADAPSAAPRAGMDDQLNEMFHLDQRLADPDVAALFQRLSNSFKLREGERKKKRAQPTAFELFGDPTAAAAAAATGDSTQLTGDLQAEGEAAEDFYMGPSVTQISSARPILDFLMMLKNATLVEDAFQQMKAMIERFLCDPFARQFVRKIVDCIVELRAQSIRFDRRPSSPNAVEPPNARSLEFNAFLKRVCEIVRETKLLDVARMCREQKASLIHDGEVNVIGVSETDSAALFDFLDSSTTQEDAAAPAATAIAAEEQEEDFFAQIE